MSIFSVGGGNAAGYDIDQSLRFEDGDSAYLSRTPSSAGNRKTWTWSGWVKRGNLGGANDRMLLDAGNAATVSTTIGFTTADKLYFVHYSGGYVFQLVTTPNYRDPASSLHVVVSVDTTQATASDRVKIYVNGGRVTAFATATYGAQNTDTFVNSSSYLHTVGARSGGTYPFDGYLAEVHFIDGQALTPASFGETNSSTNQWVPIEVTGMTYGTNGFYLPFSGTQDGDTKLLMHMDGSNGGTTFTDNSSVGASITAYGNTQTDTSVKKIGTASAKFDGTGDYVVIPSSSEYDFTGSSNGTIECWVRFNNSASIHEAIVSGGYGSSNQRTWELARLTTGKAQIRVFRYTSPWSKSAAGTTTLAADTWYHLAGVRQGDNIRIYVNGTQEGVTSGMNSYSGWNTGRDFYLGDEGASGGNALNGYIDELRFSSNTRYPDGTTFTPRTTEYGDVSIGADSSGNTNDFSATNLVATDQVLDSPTNNFATLNPLWFRTSYATTKSEGNLQSTPASAPQAPSMATIGGLTSGKWYFEHYIKSLYGGAVGIVEASPPMSYIESNTGLISRLMRYDGDKTSNGAAAVTYGSSWTAGDIIGVALNITDGELTYYINNSSQGVAYTDIASGIPSDGWTFCMGQMNTTSTVVLNFGQDSSFAGNKTAQGNQDANNKGDFYYAPPSGYLALCTDNLPDPSIADPTVHFNTVLYTGNATARTITGVGFQPDFLWVKDRINGGHAHRLADVVRGATKQLYSNRTLAEATDSTVFGAFDGDGFSIGTNGAVNTNTNTYVAWNWKAGGTASSNTDGSITSSVSANTTAGFSIISYTGNGTNGATVGHGLSQKPDLVIYKARSQASHNWIVYSSPLGATKRLKLDLTDAESTSSSQFNDTEPTSSVVTLGTFNNINQSSETFIAYCFHSVDGYSKVGSYTGNGNADGAFVYTGFRPAYIMFRRYDSAESWGLYDNKRPGYNVTPNRLYADGSGAEVSTSTSQIDMVSNGFKARSTGGVVNVSNGTYIYLAFAESPFKTSNAR